MGPRPKLLRWTALGVLAVVGVGLLGACTSSGGGANSADSVNRGGADSAPVAGAPAPAHGPAGGTAAGGTSRGTSSGAASDGTLADLDLNEAKIRVANMTVQVKRG